MVTISNRIRKAWRALLRRIGTLRWKLFATYLLVSLLPLMFFSNTITLTIETYFLEAKTVELRNYASRVSTAVINSKYLYDESLKTTYDVDIQDWAAAFGARIIVIDSRGYVSNDSNQTQTGSFYLSSNIIQALNNNTVTEVSEDKSVMMATVPITDQERVTGAVVLVSTMDEMQDILFEVGGKLVLLTFLLSVIVVILVFFISQLLLDPLKSVVAVVKRITEGHLNQRVTLTGYDEFAQLGAAFNDMAEKLEKVDQSRNEFVSNVSHELKTPLSSIKVLSDSLLLQEEVPAEMYKEFLVDISSEVDRMADIVNELLTLVRLDQTEQTLNAKPIALGKMLEDIVRRLRPLATQKNITMTLENIRPVTVEADELRLILAISNLVENGIKYTPEGGSIRVTSDCDHQNAFIGVYDTGIGISEEDQSKVFSRFYRVDKTRDRETGGTGLGLAITHKIVLLHNGSIKLTSKENEGSAFLVRIPIHFG